MARIFRLREVVPEQSVALSTLREPRKGSELSLQVQWGLGAEPQKIVEFIGDFWPPESNFDAQKLHKHNDLFFEKYVILNPLHVIPLANIQLVGVSTLKAYTFYLVIVES